MRAGDGLRLRELLGLTVGDVSPDGRDVRDRVVLDPATTKGGRKGEVFLPARLVTKLRRFLAWWQRRAEFDRHYGFHQLPHSAVTNVYRASGHMLLTQRLAR